MRNLFLLIVLGLAAVAKPQQALVIPDTLSGTTFSLTMHPDSVQFLSGNITQTIGFNNFKYLGPTLLLNKNTNVSMLVNNQVGDTTAIHWHGLHVASVNDGGPHTPIMAGNTWNPQFKVMNWAATYWYHPHLHMKTAMQAMRGAAGMIIVRDSAEAALNLPRRYGIDDFPIIVQSQQFDSLNQVNYRGMNDSIILVNGSIANYFDSVFANLPAQVVRMRLLNASQERSYNFGFTANKSFQVITNDGGLLQAPVQVTRIMLAPGERAEVLLDLNGMQGQVIYLMSYASEIQMGVTGGPTMTMGGGPDMDSPINGIDFNILKLVVGAQTANPVTTIPATLINDIPLVSSQSMLTRTINFTADNMMVMDGPFYFNDSTFDMMRIDYQIPLNNIETWKLANQTMVGHPFHLHDVSFYVLDRDGVPPAPEERGKKDVVLVYPGEVVRFITQFTDFVDSIIPYMYHCHILMHEDDGMMGQFVVMPQGWVSIKDAQGKDAGILIYPNPANNELNLRIEKESTEIVIENAIGIRVYSALTGSGKIKIDTQDWPQGLYLVSCKTTNGIITKKIIIQ